jgi:regulator of sirC expression with transglutaminase-like and TPR domain
MRHPPPDVQPLPNGYAINSIEAQCEKYIAHDPAHPRCARGLGTIYMQVGDTARARKWFAYYLNHAVAADPEAEAIYARLLASGK